MPSSEVANSAQSDSQSDASRAWRRYEEVRPRLPTARFPGYSVRVANLGDLVEHIDVFVLDGYGVLNVGATCIPGAPERLAALRAAGKQIIVLTNGATRAAEERVATYRALGFDLTRADIISSRDALAEGMAGRKDLLWGFAARADSQIEAISPRSILLGDDPADYDRADGIVLLSSGDWNDTRQALLLDALARRPRPVLVGNPDLVAPREDGFSREPGHYAHDLADQTSVVPEFYGKPFGNAFTLAAALIEPGTPPERVAMVGDTLHTDILGGAAMGWRTVLILDHGLMRGVDPAHLPKIADIRPDFIADTT